MAKQSNHLHKYKKVNIARKNPDKPFWVYKCQIPTCAHYIPLNLAEGKMCICNRCGEIMVISKHTMTQSGGGPMAMPHCVDCTKTRKDTTMQEAMAEYLKQTGQV
jgi:hypothetical protein